MVKHQRPKRTRRKLLDTHVRRGRLVEDQQATAVVHLPDQGSGRASEVLSEHEREAWDRFQRVVCDMEVGLEAGPKDSLPGKRLSVFGMNVYVYPVGCVGGDKVFVVSRRKPARLFVLRERVHTAGLL